MLMNTINIKNGNKANEYEEDQMIDITIDMIFKMEIEDKIMTEDKAATNIFNLLWSQNNYAEYEERITWSSSSYQYLSSIIRDISKTYLEPYIINMVKYYIHTYDTDNEYHTWSMSLTNGTKISLLHPISEINKKIVILAFTQYLYLTHLFGNRKLVVDKEITYFSISRIIYTGVIENLALDMWTLSFAELHTVNFLSQKLINDKYNTKTDNYTSEVVKICYFCVWKLLLTVKGSNLYSLRNLVMNSQDVDISILSKEEIREIKELFHTNRTIYVRILLVVCQEVLRREEDFDTFNLNHICEARDRDSFKIMLNSFLLEIHLLLSSNNINRKYNYEL